MQRSMSASLFVAIFALAGCEQLTATVQGVSLITALPDVREALPEELADMEAFNHQALMPVVAVVAGVGQRPSFTSSEAPTPIAGADVSLRFGSTQVPLCEVGDHGGGYLATSLTADDACGNSALVYNGGVEYVTEFETSGNVYTLTITAPSAIAQSSIVLTPALQAPEPPVALNLPTHSGTALTIDWSADPEATDRHAFITVVRVNFSGDSSSPASYVDEASWVVDAGNPVFDNTPTQPSALLDLVLNAPTPSIEVPASVFAQAGLYAVILTPVELSLQASKNLTVGSGAMAGKGSVFVFLVD